jgi:hypothetical protein
MKIMGNTFKEGEDVVVGKDLKIIFFAYDEFLIPRKDEVNS